MAEEELTTEEELAEFIQSPRRGTGDEGTIEERSVRERREAANLIDGTAAASTQKFGISTKPIRFGGTT